LLATLDKAVEAEISMYAISKRSGRYHLLPEAVLSSPVNITKKELP
jgi:hypothetical protein